MRRRLALPLVLVASRAFAQPADPVPDPQPEPPPAEPAPPPAAEPPAPLQPQPSPPPAPPVVEPPAVVDKRTATEQRLAAQAACDARAPTCDWVMTFSALERASIRRSLKALGVEVEPSPWGKTIGHISVHNEDVFAEANWLRFFNHFHVTTKERTIRREVTFDEGQLWDPELIAESARRVKDPLYTSVVAILPIKSTTEGQVDVLVITRDIWSLRLNTQYAIQENSLTNLSISISENNFFGRRKTVAMAMLMDQGSVSVGPLFIDKNFLGQHLDFRVRLEKILTRHSLDVVTRDGMHIPTTDPGGIQDDGVLRSEGSAATITLNKTLWSLASKWGGGGAITYRNAISRSYFGAGLRAYDNLDTPDPDNLAREYRMRVWSVSASATRRWGNTLKHQLEIGYNVSSTEPSLLPNFPMDPALRQDFIENVFPHNELISDPYVEYSLFLAKYKTVRNVDTFELAEDVQLGPSATVGLAQALELLGSDNNFTRPSLTLGWTFPWGRDGFYRFSAGGQMRIQDGATIDNTATAQVRAATPTLGYVRLVGQVHGETRWHDTQNAYYTLGSDGGLRAYRVSQFFGDRRVVGSLEARSVSIPNPVWLHALRLGAVVFYEAGGADDTFGRMKIYQDVGFGLRTLVPQTSRELFRFDLAFPLVDAEPGVRAGIPSFTAGFDSYF